MYALSGNHRLKFDKVRRAVVSVLVIAYLLSACMYCMPAGLWQATVLRPQRSFMEWSGLWQDWSMFSPDPFLDNTYLTASLRFDDGSATEYELPRMEKMGFVDALYRERWRKFWQDNLNESNWLCPPFSVYLARKFDSPKRHPTSVELVRHTEEIRHPDDPAALKKGALCQEQTFFRYDVSQRDLQ